MSTIPIVRCSRMAAALRFYTEVLDFELLGGGQATEDPAFCALGRQGSPLFWGTRELYVDDSDGNTIRFVEGLDVPETKPGIPRGGGQGP